MAFNDHQTLRDCLVLYVNGRRHEIGDQRATWTLAEFLRIHLRLVGTKVVCAEGDCGSCSVLVGRSSTEGDRFVYQVVDSCIVFLYQLDRCHIITVEGLKLGDTLSPVQDAMVRGHGSQCGFCTPGFVVALHGLIEQHNGLAPAPLSADQLRYGLSGNLCRCTGYVQILEAGLSIDTNKVARIAELADEAQILAELSLLGDDTVVVIGRDESASAQYTICVPRTLEAAIAFKSTHPQARIVCGATDVGVQRNHDQFDAPEILCLNVIDGFDRVELTDDRLTLGAGATFAQIEQATESRIPEYWQILTRFGSPQIRNLATIGGNIANASPIADSLPFHYVMDSAIELVGKPGERFVSIHDFYQGYKKIDLAPDELIAAIDTRLPAANESLKLYKVTKRRDMDISTVTAALLFELDGDVIAKASFAVGGVAPTVLRLPETESFIRGRPFSESTLRSAGQLAKTETSPISDVRGNATYRWQLVENLFVKSYFELSSELVVTSS